MKFSISLRSTYKKTNLGTFFFTIIQERVKYVLYEIYFLIHWKFTCKLNEIHFETATEQIGHDKQKNPMMHNFLPNHWVR